MSLAPTVSNVKIRFKFQAPIIIPTHLSHTVVYHNNFLTVRFDSLSCVIFPKSGHVNISGIKDFSCIKEALICFNHQFDSDICEDVIIIDNSTASGRLPCHPICIPKLIGNDLVTVSIRQQFFPSAVIRPKRRAQEQREDKLATIILFANGKFNIVGGKSERSIHQTWLLLCALTNIQ